MKREDLFSFRNGFNTKKLIEPGTISERVISRLWSVLYVYLCPEGMDHIPDNKYSMDADTNKFLFTTTYNYLALHIDEVVDNPRVQFHSIRNAFFRNWYTAVDLLELAMDSFDDSKSENLAKLTSYVLEDEGSSYRLVDNKFVPNIEDEQIDELERTSSLIYNGPRSHIKRAIELYSDRKNADYRNSIKESISAVESMCLIITGGQENTLGKALAKLKKSDSIDLHGSLNGAFSALYGYTNDEDGIRHAILEKDNVYEEDARFMLIACSAFVNYLAVKYEKSKDED